MKETHETRRRERIIECQIIDITTMAILIYAILWIVFIAIIY